VNKFTKKAKKGGGRGRGRVMVLGVFFLPPSHIRQDLKDFLPLSKPKKGAYRRNNNSFGVQEGAVTTSREYLQRGVRQ
jgi:hypothetical protein